MNDEDRAKPPRGCRLDPLAEDSGRRIGAQPVEIDAFLRFGFALEQCEELLIVYARRRGQSRLVRVRMPEALGRSAGIPRLAGLRRIGWSRRNDSLVALERSGRADQVGEGLAWRAFSVVVAPFDAQSLALPAARAEVSSVTPNKVSALRVDPA
jgi:hypothetical protein